MTRDSQVFANRMDAVFPEADPLWSTNDGSEAARRLARLPLPPDFWPWMFRGGDTLELKDLVHAGKDLCRFNLGEFTVRSIAAYRNADGERFRDFAYVEAPNSQLRNFFVSSKFSPYNVNEKDNLAFFIEVVDRLERDDVSLFTALKYLVGLPPHPQFHHER